MSHGLSCVVSRFLPRFVPAASYGDMFKKSGSCRKVLESTKSACVQSQLRRKEIHSGVAGKSSKEISPRVVPGELPGSLPRRSSLESSQLLSSRSCLSVIQGDPPAHRPSCFVRWPVRKLPEPSKDCAYGKLQNSSGIPSVIYRVSLTFMDYLYVFI